MMKSKLSQGQSKHHAARKWSYKVLIAFLLIIISILHYTGAAINPTIHSFYRLLYFIPIILAAFQFGFKGGVLTSLVVGVIYAPFDILWLGKANLQAVNKFLDIILFFSVGIITGTLVEKQNMSLQKLDEELKRYVLLESYTNSIIESIRSGVIAVNNDLLITTINQGAREILDIRHDCIGQNLTEVFTCCESVLEEINESIANNRSGEILELTLDNTSIGKTITGKLAEARSNQVGHASDSAGEVIVRVSFFPLTLDGVQKGLVIIFEDITEVKKLQNQLLRSEKLAALGELSTGIAHEIRNPLGIIKAIEQTMRHELKDNPEALQELEIIDEEIERANRVIKALMDFGRPAGQTRKLVSINSILEDVLTIANKYILQHNVQVNYLSSEPVYLWGDQEQLKQAFVNIIFNAVQAMPAGGELCIAAIYPADESFAGKKKATGYAWSNSYVKLVFKDTGRGISPENMEKIFNPFFTTRDDGTGLGLAIVHRIVEEHGGVIHVTSSSGVGSQFEILLPVEGEDCHEKDFDR